MRSEAALAGPERRGLSIPGPEGNMQQKLDETTKGAKPASAPTEGSADYAIADPAQFAQNMVRVGLQSQRLLADFIKRQSERSKNQPLDPLNLGGAFMSLAQAMAANPRALVEAQFELWRDFMGLWESTARRMLGGESTLVVAPKAGDKRFKDKDWQENQVFDFIKQSYLLTANWLQNTVGKVELDDPEVKHRVDFYTKQFADAIAPTNFVLTNPEVLRTTMQSNGQNLVNGLANLLDDFDRGDGQLDIRQSADAFTPGKNIAVTH